MGALNDDQLSVESFFLFLLNNAYFSNNVNNITVIYPVIKLNNI